MRLELNADQPEDTDHQKRLNAAMRMEAHISRAIDWSMAGPVVHDAILTNGRYGIGRMVRVRCYPQLRMKTGRAAMEETAKQITEWYFTDPVKKLATANEQPDIKDLPGQTKWFDMTIQELPLTVPTERASSPRSSTSGFVVRQVARLFSDGKIFQSSKRDIKPRDGYLVDCSGSMGWELTELIRVLTEKSPKGTVAIYGHDGSMVLTVIAKNGRRATDEALNALGIGESNRIDGPALAWLGQQPKLGHRYWISDGQAGGKSGCTYQAQVDAEAICSMYRIKRIESK
jgi:hypothetical protein